jgi:hypothetical protein
LVCLQFNDQLASVLKRGVLFVGEAQVTAKGRHCFSKSAQSGQQAYN